MFYCWLILNLSLSADHRMCQVMEKNCRWWYCLLCGFWIKSAAIKIIPRIADRDSLNLRSSPLYLYERWPVFPSSLRFQYGDVRGRWQRSEASADIVRELSHSDWENHTVSRARGNGISTCKKKRLHNYKIPTRDNAWFITVKRYDIDCYGVEKSLDK